MIYKPSALYKTNPVVAYAESLKELIPTVRIRYKAFHWRWKLMPKRLQDMGHCLPAWNHIDIWLPDRPLAASYQALVHESVHAFDMSIQGKWRWLAGWLFSRKKRLHYEIRAYSIVLRLREAMGFSGVAKIMYNNAIAKSLSRWVYLWASSCPDYALHLLETTKGPKVIEAMAVNTWMENK